MAEAVSTVVVGSGGGNAAAGTARKYAPLFSMLVALAIVLAVLPSALNLPQANPTQTLEYAPVPPNDEDAPPNSNMSSLGLGSSSGIDGGGAGGGEGEGGGREPATSPTGPPPSSPEFRCVGENPPRQTFDPLAPPCVPFFHGKNGGPTYQGVTDREIRLLIYLEGGISYINASDPTNRNTTAGELHDLFQPAKEGQPEHLTIRSLRSWQLYFNLRFQRYGRAVRFFVYYSGARSPDERRADAAKLLTEVDPFAVISMVTEGFEDDFLKAMARKGVLNFGSFTSRPAELYQGFPKMIWSYLPSIEQQAELYVSYICKKVVGKPAVLAGFNLKDKPRKLGMVYTSDVKQEGLIKFAKLVKQQVEACGGKIEHEARFDPCCVAQDGGAPTRESQSMSEFQQLGITTVLWPGGINGHYGKAAQGLRYEPEWIIAGDTNLDANWPVNLSQNSAAFDRRAIVVTPQTFQPGLRNSLCYRAFREVDSKTSDADLSYTCEYYRDLFQFFTGVQVAGPRLGPTSIDRGFRAIPQKYEGHPQIPACFYPVGDYTCVKDAQAEIWDARKVPPGDNKAGCWTAIDNGARYAPAGDRAWPEGNVDMGANGPITGDEPCNGYDTRVRFNYA